MGILLYQTVQVNLNSVHFICYFPCDEPEITPDLLLTHFGDGAYAVAQLNAKYFNALQKCGCVV